jgi:propanediol dehydratase large subunit
MNTPSQDIARMLVDINVPRTAVLELARGCTAAKLVDIVQHMTVLEMMMALAKMRVRRTPANQAHVTNRKEHPALLAADAAEAALRGFAEIETTVGVARYAPLNALAILIGSQTGRGGALTQCSVEEATNLRLGFRGLTTYSETLSVYGTEKAFVDGDDTPWSKAFLAAAYASRGVKTRFTSGTGSEALMGHAEGKSMLYLEARCLLVTRGAGSQGTQNGSISCIALPESLPGGVRTVLAENLIAAMLGLEVAAGNDALASHSEMRKSAKLMLQFIPGTLSPLAMERSLAMTTCLAAATLTSARWTTGTCCSATCRWMGASRRSRRRTSCVYAAAPGKLSRPSLTPLISLPSVTPRSSWQSRRTAARICPIEIESPTSRPRTCYCLDR